MEKKASAKERILRVASVLFYQEGVRAVGIDRIIEESGVAKASFYRNFATKDDLVVAYLEQFYKRHMEEIEEAKRRYPENPVEQLYVVLECVSARMEKPGYRGCPFLNAAVEFPDANHPVHERVTAYHKETYGKIAEIAKHAGAADPEAFAAQLTILFNGSLMTAYLERPNSNSGHLRHAAAFLFEKHKLGS
ncbi:TetR/AcrR family transcriptional regulator [Paenibacillus ehimensis]|uniref:TetR/AcrR family transcriptional regulator n=1 Tax=Paenibacillus ehimensis TaxID=79264 RepID=UPI00047129F6|nr:TetR/AcrR family transcriptional regulator [Paenibacillus ehimensis]